MAPGYSLEEQLALARSMKAEFTQAGDKQRNQGGNRGGKAIDRGMGSGISTGRPDPTANVSTQYKGTGMLGNHLVTSSGYVARPPARSINAVPPTNPKNTWQQMITTGPVGPSSTGGFYQSSLAFSCAQSASKCFPPAAPAASRMGRSEFGSPTTIPPHLRAVTAPRPQAAPPAPTLVSSFTADAQFGRLASPPTADSMDFGFTSGHSSTASAPSFAIAVAPHLRGPTVVDAVYKAETSNSPAPMSWNFGAPKIVPQAASTTAPVGSSSSTDKPGSTTSASSTLAAPVVSVPPHLRGQNTPEPIAQTVNIPAFSSPAASMPLHLHGKTLPETKAEAISAPAFSPSAVGFPFCVSDNDEKGAAPPSTMDPSHFSKSSTREPIVTNWGPDPDGPVIPAHLKQRKAAEAIEDISRVINVPYGKLTHDGNTLSFYHGTLDAFLRGERSVSGQPSGDIEMNLGPTNAQIEHTVGLRYTSEMDVDEESVLTATPVAAKAPSIIGTGKQLSDSVWAIKEPFPARNPAMPITRSATIRPAIQGGLRADVEARWDLPVKRPAPSEEAARARAASGKQFAPGGSENARPNAAALNFIPAGPFDSQSNAPASRQGSSTMEGARQFPPGAANRPSGPTSTVATAPYAAPGARHTLKPGEKTIKDSIWAN